MHYFGDIGHYLDNQLICPIGGYAGSRKYKIQCKCDVSYDIYHQHWVYSKMYPRYKNNHQYSISLDYLKLIKRNWFELHA